MARVGPQRHRKKKRGGIREVGCMIIWHQLVVYRGLETVHGSDELYAL